MEGIALTRMTSAPCAVVLVLLLHTALVAAPQPEPSSARPEAWPLSLSVGGGITRPGKALIEGTLSPHPFGPHLSFGIAGGNRVYGEIGVNVLLSVGIGVGDAVGAADRQTAVHLFVGLPLPIVGGGPAGWVTFSSDPFALPAVYLYAEPFFRPEWTSARTVYANYGVLLKVRVGLTRPQWDRRPHRLLDGAIF